MTFLKHGIYGFSITFFNNDLHLLISENAKQRLLDIGLNIREKHIMGFFSIFFKKNPKS
jgi:hypothetical protein